MTEQGPDNPGNVARFRPKPEVQRDEPVNQETVQQALRILREFEEKYGSGSIHTVEEVFGQNIRLTNDLMKRFLGSTAWSTNLKVPPDAARYFVAKMYLAKNSIERK